MDPVMVEQRMMRWWKKKSWYGDVAGAEEYWKLKKSLKFRFRVLGDCHW